jgi:serralysin
MTFSSQDISGILSGEHWVTNSLTFSFPTAASNYGDFYGVDDGNGGNGEPYSGFNPISADQQDVVRHDLDLISQYTVLTFTEITETDSEHADLRFADSAVPVTDNVYSPFDPFGGDVWFGNIASDLPTKGSYAYFSILYDIGAALGLKDGTQDDPIYGVLPAEHNSSEWAVMTSHSFIGSDFFYNISDGSGSQTYMVDDIAAYNTCMGRISIQMPATPSTRGVRPPARPLSTA